MISQTSLTLKPNESIMSRRVRYLSWQSFDNMASMTLSAKFPYHRGSAPSISKRVPSFVGKRTKLDDSDHSLPESFVSTDSENLSTNMETEDFADSSSEFSIGSAANLLSDDSYKNFFKEIAKCPSLSDVTSEDSFDITSHKSTDLLTAESLHSARQMTMTGVDSEFSHYSSEEATVEENKEKIDFFFENFDEKYEDKRGFESSTEKISENVKNFVPADDVVKKFLDDFFNEIDLFHEDKESTDLETYNKVALFEELCGLVDEIFISLRVLSFIRRKAVDYYRRRGRFRYITPDGNYNVKRFHRALCSLNEVLVLEKGVTERTTNRISQLEQIESFQEEMLKDELENLRNLFQHTFNNGNRCDLNEAVEMALRKMANFRDEFREVLSVFVVLQNKVSELKSKMDVLNDIGQGLKLHNYENLLMEVRGLEKKNEEKKNLLAKKRDILNKTWGKTAHFKLGRHLADIRMETEKLNLNKNLWKRNFYRKHVHKLKVERERTRKAVQELTDKSGILAKLHLMHDYDETVENIEMKKRNVEILRQTKQDLEAKIQKLEKT